MAGNFPGNAFQSPSGDFILNTRLSNEDDTGNYTCVVTTSEGVASAEVFVQVVGEAGGGRESFFFGGGGGGGFLSSGRGREEGLCVIYFSVSLYPSTSVPRMKAPLHVATLTELPKAFII